MSFLTDTLIPKGVFFMLKQCTLIGWLDVRYDDEQASVVVNNRILRFSPTEYKLMRLFFTQKNGSRDNAV